MKDKPPNYLSYLVRLWGTGKGAWRASLESPMTGERHGFASLKDLFAFLQAQADAQADLGEPSGRSLSRAVPATSQDEPAGEK